MTKNTYSFFLCLYLSFITIYSNAQNTFNKTYTTDSIGECGFNFIAENFGMSTVEVEEGYIGLSIFTSKAFCGWSAYGIWKMDYEGNVLWEKKYGEEGYWYNALVTGKLVATQDGNFVFAGWVEQTDEINKGVLLKFDAQGDTLWRKTYGGLYHDANLSAVTEAENGDLVTVGTTRELGSGNPADENPNTWLMRTNAEGEVLWERGLNGNKVETGKYISMDYDGGYTIGGWRGNAGIEPFNGYYFKTDAMGQIKWVRSVINTEVDNCFANLIPATGGGYYASYCGDTMVNNNLIHSIRKLNDSNLLKDWQYHFFDGKSAAYVISFEELENENIIIAGTWLPDIYDSNAITHGYIAQLSPQGELVWERVFKHHELFSRLEDVSPTSDGGFISIGYSWNPNRQKQDMWLLKLDENGCLSNEVCDSLFTDIEVLDPAELSPPTLFPNPTKSHLQIQIPTHLTSKPLQIQLTNIEGRAVLKEWIEDGTELNIADLAAGIYIATWLQDGQALKREKVVVLE
ncbi:MAG: T9SS type A sorting domain-containing protein [Chitinophagales bacterium]